MAYQSREMDREMCLTCHYFKCVRSVKMIGNHMYIEYHSNQGKCSLWNDFPRSVNCRPTSGSFCNYKRWIELP
ncbi:MAG: hypothetical protein MJ033_03015 [Victivallaceae bacterium]|nr:hypothetical protein [Victivallaceae bacterium]